MKNNNIIYYKTTYKSPLGELTIASDTDNITGVWLEGQKYFEESIKDNTVYENNNLKVLIQTKEWLTDTSIRKPLKFQKFQWHLPEHIFN